MLRFSQAYYNTLPCKRQGAIQILLGKLKDPVD